LAEVVSQKFSLTEEIGRTGLAYWYGMVEERYLKDLYGADGIKVFDEMRRRDPTIRALLYATKVMARTVKWSVVPASTQPGDKEAAFFLETCLDDMSHTVSDAVDDILSMLAFGWHWAELCYKRRQGPGGKIASRYDDGRIGWRKWAPRKQSSWYKWEFDETGGVVGMWQWPQPERGGPAIFLPIEKSLLFTTEPDSGNPEGVSILEACYETWYFLKNLLPILGMGFERSFVGLPWFNWKERPDASDKAAVEELGKGLRQGSKAYVSLPPSVEGELKSVANPVAGDVLATIQYFRILILQAALADYINLGTGTTGSRALGQTKLDFFLMAVNGWLDKIETALNRFAVPRLFGFNEFPALSAYPQIEHTVISRPDLGELGSFVQAIASFLPLSATDHAWLRVQAGMPEYVPPKPEADKPEPVTGEEKGKAAEKGREAEAAEFAEVSWREKHRRWVTMRDNLVCAECQGLEGEIAAPGETFSNGKWGPPAHLACRCHLEEVGVQPDPPVWPPWWWVVRRRWVTMKDAKVCGVCQEMEGETASPWSAFSNGLWGPPAHPNCRCDVEVVA